MDTAYLSTKDQDIIKTAHNLFWKHGIKRVTVGEICREAGVSKMTFYRSFPNKTALARTVLENLFEANMKKYRTIMGQDTSFDEKMRQLILLKFEDSRKISVELIKDLLNDQDTGLHEFWEARRKESLKVVWDDFRHAKEMGWLRKDLNLEFLIYFNEKMTEMVMDEKLQAMYKNNMHHLIMEITNLFFYGILPRPQSNK